MVKAPLCGKCLEERELCGACQQKSIEGKLTDADISLARVLNQLEKRQLVKEPSFERAVDLGNLILIVTTENVGNLVGKGGRVVRLLSKEMGKKVRVINGKDFKTSIQDLVAPARVTGINIVYTPDGEQTKVIIPAEDKYRLIADMPTIIKAANALSDKTVVFELR